MRCLAVLSCVIAVTLAQSPTLRECVEKKQQKMQCAQTCAQQVGCANTDSGNSGFGGGRFEAIRGCKEQCIRDAGLTPIPFNKPRGCRGNQQFRQCMESTCGPRDDQLKQACMQLMCNCINGYIGQFCEGPPNGPRDCSQPFFGRGGRFGGGGGSGGFQGGNSRFQGNTNGFQGRFQGMMGQG